MQYVIKDVATPNVVQAEGLKKPQSPTNDFVGTRKSLNSMGFDNEKIGFDNGKVTYNGQAIVEPSFVDEGTSYAPPTVNRAGAVDYLKNNGYKPLRDGLNEKGVKNERIGWNGETGAVTIDGHDIIKPKYNVDGTTYVSDNDLNYAYSKAEALGGNPLVAARDYTTSQIPGVGNIVDWDGENVLIGGQALKPSYVQDGVAYVPKSQLDTIIKSYKDSNGIFGNNSVVDSNNLKYGAMKDDQLLKILNRDSFDYDLDSDEIWQNHENRMMGLAKDAYRRVLNNNNTSLGGASGAVLSEANAAMNDYLSALADDAYSFRQDAYKRYTDEGDWDRSVLGDIYDASNNKYTMDYTANRDNISDANITNSTNDAEKWKWKDYNMSVDNFDLSKKSTDSSIRSNDLNTAIQVASLRGYFSPEDEEYIPGLWRYRNADGTYSITPTSSEMRYIYDYAYNQAKGGYDAYSDIYGG